MLFRRYYIAFSKQHVILIWRKQPYHIHSRFFENYNWYDHYSRRRTHNSTCTNQCSLKHTKTVSKCLYLCALCYDSHNTYTFGKEHWTGGSFLLRHSARFYFKHFFFQFWIITYMNIFPSELLLNLFPNILFRLNISVSYVFRWFSNMVRFCHT